MLRGGQILWLICAVGTSAWSSLPQNLKDPSFEVEAIDRQLLVLSEKIASLEKNTKSKISELHRFSNAAGGAHFVWEEGDAKIQAKRQLARLIKASLHEDIKNIKDYELQKKSLEEEKVWILSTQSESKHNNNQALKILNPKLASKKHSFFKCQNFPLKATENPQLELTQDFGIRKDIESGLEWNSMGWWVANVQGKVRACAPGLVTFSGSIPGRGQVLIIEHAVNQMTVYANLDLLDNQDLPKKGQRIKAGEVLGVSKEKFYFEVRLDGLAVNPRRVLSQDKVPFRT